MIVRTYFNDDHVSTAWIQHDVYHKALGVIRGGCRDQALHAARILNVDPPAWAEHVEAIDHRTLQMAHDLLAAAWRFRSDAAQAPLPLEPRARDLAGEWLDWLGAEVRSWGEALALIRLVGAITTEQNTELGYEAENQLSSALIERFADVPGPHDLRRLSERPERSLSEGAGGDHARATAEPSKATSTQYDTGCICVRHHRRRCNVIPCKTLCEIAMREGWGGFDEADIGVVRDNARQLKFTPGSTGFS